MLRRELALSFPILVQVVDRVVLRSRTCATLQVQINLKPGFWISAEMQATTLRALSGGNWAVGEKAQCATARWLETHVFSASWASCVQCRSFRRRKEEQTSDQ